MRTVAIIQARMGSTRLPGKILADIAGTPMLAHVIRRARTARHLDEVVVATTVSNLDDVVVDFCRDKGVGVCRGPEDDVLQRYLDAARQFHAAVVVRITADCPFIDPSIIDRMIADYRDGAVDYASNTIRPTWPDGLDVEVFSADALARAGDLAALRSEREHVTPFFKKHPELFRLRSVEHEPDLSAMRWTVDEPSDLEFARRVVARMGSRDFGFEELVAMLDDDPSVGAINSGIQRDAGYARSLVSDTIVHDRRMQ